MQPMAELGPGDLGRLLEERFRDDGIAPFLRHLGARAAADGLRCWLVGGSVRDLLLGRRSKDLDVAVTSDALGFVRRARAGAPIESRATEFDRFRTVLLDLDNGWQCDVATTRAESYPVPGQPPEARFLDEGPDLVRRDFTVNAMACSLAPDDFGGLRDDLGGRADLAVGLLRLLHDRSFVDDPTRLFRGLRFEARLGFRFEEGTERLAREALEGGALDTLPAPTLARELDLTLLEDGLEGVLDGLERLSVLAALRWPGRTRGLPAEARAAALRARRMAGRLARAPSALWDRVLPVAYPLLAETPAGLGRYNLLLQPPPRRRADLEQAARLRPLLEGWLRRAPGEVDPRLRRGVPARVLLAVAAVACRDAADEERCLGLVG